MQSVITSPRTRPSQRGSLGRARVDSGAPFPSKWIALLRVPWRWYQLSGLRLLLLEGSSIPLRMAAIYRSGAWVRRGYMEPVPKGLDQSPTYQSQPHKVAYIRYIERIQASLRFLSIFDYHLVSQSWRDGWESCARTYTEQNQAGMCSLDTSESGNSTPPPVAQQSTTHDPLNPLPSQG